MDLQMEAKYNELKKQLITMAKDIMLAVGLNKLR